jgi:hypothetical protein
MQRSAHFKNLSAHLLYSFLAASLLAALPKRGIKSLNMIDIENRSWINVGVAQCPTCKEISTGHIISNGQLGTTDWFAITLEYYCFSCKSSFKIPGTKTLHWLPAVFKNPAAQS